MKKLLFISVLLLAFACSKEDEASEQSEQTFLERYDGFEFLSKQGNGTHIISFKNSVVYMMEYFTSDPEPMCLEIHLAEENNPDITYIAFGTGVKIIENESTLVIRSGSVGGYNYSHYSVDASGEKLTTGELILSKTTDEKYSDYCN
ncbi:MAG: hypothetical protein CBD72_02740 [Flavobacteriaceae bacterium TMED212]|nr:MAG: hypothetical protein CBD72_02740 [Flavobacteriaceae bacterium TMED212]|tara:strand:- start:341 stop:781 length:441 start_codon:yes stop_codon:yes gene_type:complete